MDKISESGVITVNGQLRMPMDRLNAFFRRHKGERVVVQFEAAVPGSSAAQLAYYYNYILPTIQTALRETGERKSEDQIDRWLLGIYPQDTGAALSCQLSQTQMSDYLDWLKQYAAENLYVYIEDSKSL